MFKILIADDEYYIREGLEKTIEWDEYGAQAIGSAANGREALELFKRENPDIVITDVKMPEMDGIEFIKEIRKTDDNVKIIIISGFNDFEYVKESLKYGVENYILKPINEDELSETIINVTKKIENERGTFAITNVKRDFIKDNILCRIVTNSISSEEAYERLKFLEIDLNHKNFTVAVIKILNFNKIYFKNINDARNDLKELINEKYICSYNNFIFFDLEGNLVFLFHYDEEIQYSLIEKSFQNLINILNNIFKYEIFITIGSQAENLKGINESYKNAIELQKYIYIYPANSRISYNKIEKQKENINNVMKINTSELIDCIKNEDKIKLLNYFENLKRQMSSSEQLSVEQIQGYTIEMVSGLIIVAKEKGLTNTGLSNPEHLFANLFQQPKLSKTLDWLKNISLELIEEISENRKKPKPLVELVLDYLIENYSKEMSLKTIADQFYVNSSYLGQIFKSETGKLFSEYLNTLRIEKAKELLEKTNMKASQIAVKVGYSDPNYFYKVFKKYTGHYPTEHE